MAVAPPHITALIDRLDLFYQQIEQRDLAAAGQLFADDAAILAAGVPPVEGGRAVREFWRSTLDAFEVNARPLVDEWTELGDSVVLRGRAVGVMVPRDGGAAVPIDVWFLQVYRTDSAGVLRFWRGANGPRPGS